MTFHCSIISQSDIKNYEKLKSAFFQTPSGEIQILANHAESFFSIKAGNIILQKDSGEKESIPSAAGECHFRDNELKVIL